jgi:hypothetical protein
MPSSLRNLAIKAGPYGRFGQFKTLEAKLAGHANETESKIEMNSRQRTALSSFLLISLRSDTVYAGFKRVSMPRNQSAPIPKE